jgi:hypothetical protein
MRFRIESFDNHSATQRKRTMNGHAHVFKSPNKWGQNTGQVLIFQRFMQCIVLMGFRNAGAAPSEKIIVGDNSITVLFLTAIHGDSYI